MERALEMHVDTVMTSRESNVQEAERMADVTVIPGWNGLAALARQPVSRMIMRDEGDGAIGIVAADVTPVDCVTADEDGQCRRDENANNAVIAEAAEPHPNRL
jgi:hypothetical protein